MHKTVFKTVTLSRGAAFSYLLLIFVYYYLFDIHLFLENHSIASQYFFTHVLGINQRITLLQKPFYSIFRYFVAHLRYAFLLLRAVIFPILSFEILYRCFFVLLLQSMYKRKFHKSYPSAEMRGEGGGGGDVARACVTFLGLFWVYYSMFTKT